MEECSLLVSDKCWREREVSERHKARCACRDSNEASPGLLPCEHSGSSYLCVFIKTTFSRQGKESWCDAAGRTDFTLQNSGPLRWSHGAFEVKRRCGWRDDKRRLALMSAEVSFIPLRCFSSLPANRREWAADFLAWFLILGKREIKQREKKQKSRLISNRTLGSWCN